MSLDFTHTTLGQRVVFAPDRPRPGSPRRSSASVPNASWSSSPDPPPTR